MTLQDKMLEYEVLQEIKSDTVFFATEENKVLLKEIPIIEDDLYREIYFYIDTAFEDINERIIFYVSNNEVQKVTNTRISDVVDEVCYQVYPGALSVNNEMINKENITTSPSERLNLLANLIADGRLDIKIALVENNKNYVSFIFLIRRQKLVKEPFL